jgi:hypothetical protein
MERRYVRSDEVGLVARLRGYHNSRQGGGYDTRFRMVDKGSAYDLLITAADSLAHEDQERWAYESSLLATNKDKTSMDV